MIITASTPEHAAERLDAFAAAWSVLARLLLAVPDHDLLDDLAAPGHLDEWPLDRDEPTVWGLREMQACFDSGETTEDLCRDYDALFVGPRHAPATPFESAYRPGETVTPAVRAAYERAGLADMELGDEPDDHVGLEFTFLGLLCLQALDRWDEGRPEEANQALDQYAAFLDDHVVRWVPALLSAVIEQARTRFYRAAAALALGAIEQSAQWRR